MAPGAFAPGAKPALVARGFCKQPTCLRDLPSVRDTYPGELQAMIKVLLISVLSLLPFGATWAAASGTDYQLTSVYVTSWDGTQLAVDVYRPARAGVALPERMPVLFSQMRGGL